MLTRRPQMTGVCGEGGGESAGGGETDDHYTMLWTFQ